MDVSFNCSVVSSPQFSHVTWKHGINIVDTRGGDDKYTVVSDTRQNTTPGTEGMETVSTLTIHELNGFDSNTVECFAEYLASPVEVLAEVRTEVILSVLGEY